MNISIEAKKVEAIFRMKELGVFDETIRQFEALNKISLSEPPFGALYWIEGEDLERVKKFEQEYNVLVFIIIRNFTASGVMDSYLFVSDYPEEWSDDRKLLREGETTAYVYNHAAPCCSEMGHIGIARTVTAGLRRTW